MFTVRCRHAHYKRQRTKLTTMFKLTYVIVLDIKRKYIL